MSCAKISIMPAPFYPPIHTLTSGGNHAMSYPHHHGRSGHHPRAYTPWSLQPTGMTSSAPSASPFSPTNHVRTARNASEIIPRLYISDLSFAENPSLLSSYRITHIMSTLPDNVYRPPPSLLPFQPARMQIPVEDTPFAELAAHLPTTTAWIRAALAADPEARVLVHCVEGVSRSVSVVAAFLMSQYGWTADQAVQYVKSKRMQADPNFGFVQQLHEYGRDSLGMGQARR